MRGEDTLAIVDLTAYPPYLTGDPLTRAIVDLAGARSVVIAPLRKDAVTLGAITLYREEVRPFSDKQIALLQNFAAQAVIAMENARLLTETREALEQQTATAEVLGVINSSPGELAPVFDAMVERAARLCEADEAALRTFHGDLLHLVAVHGSEPDVAARLRQLGPTRAFGLYEPFARGERVVHIADVRKTHIFRDDPVVRERLDLRGIRTWLAVALHKEGVLLGVINVHRHTVRPFTDKQIALLQNFAAQAVIAMENARLLTETREALEQQTATAEVLQVINSSPGDLAPVFEAILDKAMPLSSAAFGALMSFDGEQVRAVSTRGFAPELVDLFASPFAPRRDGDSPYARFLRGEALLHIPDMAAEEVRGSLASHPRALVEIGGARTGLELPLRKDDALLGSMWFYRQEVRPFSEKQIALLQNFAAQAVIAMENARLLTETREALEQQTATAEVLQVINSSPGDLAPVFDAMLDKAMRLCGVDHASLELYDGESMHAVAVHGASDMFAETLREGYPATELPASRSLLEGGRFVEITDAAQIDHIAFRTAAEVDGIRSVLFVPLRRDGALLGMFGSARREVRPFSEKEIALVENFAAQAVIAMENARLLTETREALEQQTATAEVLQVINSSPGYLAPVFDAMLEKATSLCEAEIGILFTHHSGSFIATAWHGTPVPFREFLTREPLRPSPETGLGRMAIERRLIHLSDVAERDSYRQGDPLSVASVELGGIRTFIAVPLVTDDTLVGAFVLYRQEVRPFTEKQIALLQSFAAQAVIAMENARLLGELRQRTGDLQESLEYQTAISDVLKVISRSAFDLDAVMEAVVASAIRLCRADHAGIYRNENGGYRWAGGYAPTSAYEEHERDLVLLPGPGTIVGRAALEGCPVQIADAWIDPRYEAKDDAREGGVHTMLGVPLLREGSPIGVIGLARKRVELFTDKQIALVTTFADQAVIAIENARLFDELRERTEELAARQAELRVTFDNMGDGVVMFDEELRLAAWNRNFQELLDLPDAVLAARPSYAEYLRILAERGEFGSDDIEGELQRRLAETDQELRLERTRPDGRVIEVRRNAVPGGGFVLIYSDITERKEAEARLRAARDTAEGALRELEAAQANLIHAQKMAALGQLTAGIAHEIKNPLNFVNNFAGLSVELLDELKEAAAPALAVLSDETRAEAEDIVATLTGNLEKIAEHGRRADGIVRSMLDHSRGGSGERQRVDLNALVDEALNLAYHGARAQDQNFDIILERDLEHGIAPLELMPQDITRVLLNLFGNGFYAVGKRRRETADAAFHPTLNVATRDLGGDVVISVRDNGTGIAPELRDKLFQPFFTTKPTGEGTGLGLSISWDIVTQQHGGTIAVNSVVGEYTEFTIRLPRRIANGAGLPTAAGGA